MDNKTITSFVILFMISIFGFTQSLTRFSQKDNGRHIKIKKGHAFDIIFKDECLTCGYKWRIVSLDSDAIKLLVDSFKSTACKGCVGGNVDHFFRFRVHKSKTSILEFAYYSPANLPTDFFKLYFDRKVKKVR